MKQLQQEIDRIKNGIILEIKLLNTSELEILIGNNKTIADKFYHLVSSICKQREDKNSISMYDGINRYTIYIILNNSLLNSSNDIVHELYSKLHFYIDREYPESYFACSIGSIKFNGIDNNIDSILPKLNYCMRPSNNYSFFHEYNDNSINYDYIKQSNSNLNLLKNALLNKKAKFLYQPVVNSKTREIEYYECLLRIPSNEQGKYISVGSMVEEAENKGLIYLVDIYAIEMSIKKLKEKQSLRLSVNISNAGILNKKLLNKIESLLKKEPDVGSRLIIEITETSSNKDFKATKYFINRMRSYGCLVALDDFGSGFTSLQQLLKLPVDIIKIDGSYVKDILENDRHKSFVEALINLSHDLGIKIVAEFVENKEIMECLLDMKIDNMQGDFFSAPRDLP